MAQVLLRVENHHKMLAEEFYNQLLKGQSVDVMLAAAGSFIKAHRLVLAISSPYFKELFVENPDDHPVVMLKDVELSELWLLLQFIYCGEVKLQQKDLTKFLKVGAMLQVKGLFTTEDKCPIEQKDVLNIKPENDDMQQSRTDSIPKASGAVLPTVQHDLLPPKRLKTVEESEYNFNSSPLSSVNQEHQKFETLVDPDLKRPMVTKDHHYRKSAEERFQNECPICHHHFSSKYNLKIHIRDKHIVQNYQKSCNLCNKVMRNPSCFRVHMRNHHKMQSSVLSKVNNGIKTFEESPTKAHEITTLQLAECN